MNYLPWMGSTGCYPYVLVAGRGHQHLQMGEGGVGRQLEGGFPLEGGEEHPPLGQKFPLVGVFHPF